MLLNQHSLVPSSFNPHLTDYPVPPASHFRNNLPEITQSAPSLQLPAFAELEFDVVQLWCNRPPQNTDIDAIPEKTIEIYTVPTGVRSNAGLHRLFHSAFS